MSRTSPAAAAPSSVTIDLAAVAHDLALPRTLEFTSAYTYPALLFYDYSTPGIHDRIGEVDAPFWMGLRFHLPTERLLMDEVDQDVVEWLREQQQRACQIKGFAKYDRTHTRQTSRGQGPLGKVEDDRNFTFYVLVSSENRRQLQKSHPDMNHLLGQILDYRATRSAAVEEEAALGAVHTASPLPPPKADWYPLFFSQVIIQVTDNVRLVDTPSYIPDESILLPTLKLGFTLTQLGVDIKPRDAQHYKSLAAWQRWNFQRMLWKLKKAESAAAGGKRFPPPPSSAAPAVLGRRRAPDPPASADTDSAIGTEQLLKEQEQPTSAAKQRRRFVSSSSATSK